MSNLFDYLNTVDKNATAREARIQNPELAVKMFGLSDDEQAAVMSGDKYKVAKLIGISADTVPSIHSNGCF